MIQKQSLGFLYSIFITIFAVFCSIVLCGQEVLWANTYGAPDFTLDGEDGFFTSMEIDPEGNILIAGNLSGVFDLDPSPDIFEISADPFDVVIFKSTPSGDLIWAHVFNHEEGNSFRDVKLKLDSNGNIIICGSFNGILDVDISDETLFLIDQDDSSSDTFFIKLDPEGQVIWTNQFEASTQFNPYISSNINVDRIHVDDSDNIYILGTGGDIDLDFGPDEFITNRELGTSVIAKYSPEGNLLWGANFGPLPGLGGSNFFGMESFMNGDILIVGDLNHFEATQFDMNPDPDLEHLIEIEGNPDEPTYLLRLDSNGEFLWVKILGDGIDIEAWDFDIGSNDEIVVSGYLNGPCDLDPGPGEFFVDPQSQEADFILKLTGNGDFDWATVLLGTSSSSIATSNVSIKNSDEVMFGGRFNQSLNLNTPFESTQIESSGARDCFLGKMNMDGSLEYIQVFGGDGDDGFWITGIANSGRMYGLGFFHESVDLSFGSESNPLTAAGDDAFFLMEFSDDDALNSFSPKEDRLTIYPIPTSDFLSVDLPSNEIARRTDLIDLTGKVLVSAKSTSQVLHFDLRGVPAGIYLLRIETDEGISQRRVVKL